MSGRVGGLGDAVHLRRRKPVFLSLSGYRLDLALWRISDGVHIILTFLSEGWQRGPEIPNTHCDYVQEEDPDEVEPAIRLRKPLLIRRGRITFVNVHFFILYTFL